MGILDRPIERRRFSLAVAASPLALAASRAAADQFDVATPPVFDRIAPSSLAPVTPAATRFRLDQVRLLDSPFLTAQHWNIGYVKRLDPDRLLHTFRLNAGLPSTAAPLGGWEDPTCELRGHFLGHYLSGLAIGFASTGDGELRQRG